MSAGAAYTVTAWRDRDGHVWEPVHGFPGYWTTDGAADALPLTQLAGAFGPLTAVDVDDPAAVLAEVESLRAELAQLRAGECMAPIGTPSANGAHRG